MQALLVNKIMHKLSLRRQENRPDLFQLSEDENVVEPGVEEEIRSDLTRLNNTQLIRLIHRLEQPVVFQTNQERIEEVMAYARAIFDGLNWDAEFQNSEECVQGYVEIEIRLSDAWNNFTANGTTKE